MCRAWRRCCSCVVIGVSFDEVEEEGVGEDGEPFSVVFACEGYVGSWWGFDVIGDFGASFDLDAVPVDEGVDVAGVSEALSVACVGSFGLESCGFGLGDDFAFGVVAFAFAWVRHRMCVQVCLC